MRQSLISAKFLGRSARYSRRRRPTLAFERLESRQLLAIDWANEGILDGFAAAFPVTAANPGGPVAARAVVHQALDMWETVMGGWSFDVTIVMGTPPNSPNALASTLITASDNFSVPTAATIVVRPTVTWFIDQTPADHVEFPTVINSFAANGLVGGTDLLSTILHEMGHALGFADQGVAIDAYVSTDTGVLDPLDPNFPLGTTLYSGFLPLGGIIFSKASGLHIFEQPLIVGAINYPGFPFDAMTRGIAPNQRRLISDLDVQIMDIYAATVVLPSTLPGFNFFADLNQTTGVLTLNGDLGVDQDDDFILRKVGDFLAVAVAGKEMLFDRNAITAININSGLGSDRVQVLMSPGLPIHSDGNPIPEGVTISVVDNGPAADSDLILFIAAQSTVFEVDDTKVVRNGSAVNYTLNGVEQLLTYVLGTSGDSIRVDSTPAGINKMIVFSGGGDDSIDIEGLGAGTNLELICDAGSDNIFLGGLLKADMDGIRGDIMLLGGGGASDDVLYVYDQSNNSPSSYVLTQTEIQRGARTITHNGLEDIEIRTGDKTDAINVHSMSTPTEIVSGLGGDTILVDSNGIDPGGLVDGVDSLLTIRGGVDAADDTLILNDASDASGDILTVTDTTIGEGPNDTFFGATGAVEYHDIERLFIFMGRNQDAVHIKSTDPGTVTTINGTLGSDSMEVSSLDGPDGRIGNADGIRSPLFLLGDGGDDILVLDDSTDKTADTVTITASRVGEAVGDNFFGLGGYVDYSSFAFMTMFNGSADDKINVQATAAGMATTINAGDGDDRFDIDSNTAANSLGNVNAIVSSLTVNGQGGADVAILDDSGDAVPNLYTVSDTQVGASVIDTLFGVDGQLTYSSLADLSILNGAEGETVRIIGTATGTATTIDAGSGDDQFLIDSNGPVPGGNVDGIKSLLSIFGGAGSNNTLVLNDISDASPDVFTVAAGAIGAELGDTMFGSGGRLSYDSFAALEITGSSGGNTIYIRSTDASLALNAGFNTDTVHIDSNGPMPGGTVDTIAHALVINGGGGLDQLRLDDAGDTTGGLVTITEGTIGAGPSDMFFSASGKLHYSNFFAIQLNTGSAADTINVQSTGAGKPLTIDAGDGLDQVTVSSTIGGGGNLDLVRSTVSVHGGADGATLLVDDSGDTSADTVHITPVAALAGDIGAGPGDNYFGAGGSLEYLDVISVKLSMGDTLGDLIVAAPSPTLAGTKFTLDGNNPTTIPGDVLKVNMGGVSNPLHTPDLPGAGSYTSSDHAEIAYVEIEETQIIMPIMLPADNLDNVYVVQVNDAQGTLEVFDENPPAGRPIYTAPLAAIAGLSLDMLGGDDEVVLDLGRNGAELLQTLHIDMGRGNNRIIVAGGTARMDALATGGSLDVVVVGGAELLTGRLEWSGLSLADQRSKVTILPGATQASVVTSLSIEQGATLDITDNALVVNYARTSPAAVIREQLLTGRGGAGFETGWDGTGITSSTAAAANPLEAESQSVGYAENSLLPLGPYSSFRGREVDNTSVLIAYTQTGDANLDGLVNDDDVTIVGATYAPGVPQPVWALGDFEYNGVVDDDDVTLLGAFYDTNATPQAPPVLDDGQAIPEPAFKAIDGMIGIARVASAGPASIVAANTGIEISAASASSNFELSFLADLKLLQVPVDDNELINLLAGSIVNQGETEFVNLASPKRSVGRRMQTADSLWAHW